MPAQRWVRLDVGYFRHPRAVAAKRDGRALHLASICWAGDMLTDGHVPEAVVGSLLHEAGVGPRAVDWVTDAGLWLPNGDGFDVRDFLDRNVSRADVEAERERWRERQRRKRRGGDGRYEAEPDA